MADWAKSIQHAAPLRFPSLVAVYPVASGLDTARMGDASTGAGIIVLRVVGAQALAYPHCRFIVSIYRSLCVCQYRLDGHDWCGYRGAYWSDPQHG